MRVSLESSFLSSQKSNKGSKKKKFIRISLRIHPAHFPTAGLTVNTLKRGKRVVVVIAEIRKSEAHFFLQVTQYHLALKLNNLLTDLFSNIIHQRAGWTTNAHDNI